MPTAVESIVEQISGMTAIELSDLKKALEEKFGVTAAAPVFAGGYAPGGPAAPAAPVEEEQTEFDVILKEAGGTKLQVIKVVRELTGLGLKEAKDLVDSAPKPIKQGIPREEADSIKAAIAEAGGTVEIK